MLYPSINELRKKADSKYTLVAMASKRARDIIDGKPVIADKTPVNKPVSIATEEIYEDKITYSRYFSSEEEAIELEAQYAEAEEEAEAEAEEEAETEGAEAAEEITEENE